VESTVWGRGDVYDIRSMSDRSALDGTRYKDCSRIMKNSVKGFTLVELLLCFFWLRYLQVW